jgi:tetratricopeptide (TPR) repeat protein
MDELQDLVDAMHLSEPMNTQQLDQLAEQIKGRLNLNLGQKQYRDLAAQVAKLSIERRNNSNSVTPTSTSTNGTSPEKISGLSPKNSGFFLRNENSKPIGVSSSPNVTHRRGRSPARSTTDAGGSGFKSFNSAFRKQSPLRNMFTSSKIPPQNQTPEASAKHSSARQRSASPAFAGLFRRNNRQEEKKESASPPEEAHLPSSRMMDQTQGASPQRQRAPSPLNVVQANYAQPNQQASSFIPSSPMMQRPSTPVEDRPPSRSASPFNARPGLQEDDDVDDSISISARSPVPRSPVRTFHNYPPASNNHHLPKHPRSMHPSAGADMDPTRQPGPLRAHSRSPMRRPADDDNDATRQPAVPRSFSRSPMRGNRDVSDVPDLSGLSMPDFEPDSNGGEALFTPPPRAMPAPRPHDESSFLDAMSVSREIGGGSDMRQRMYTTPQDVTERFESSVRINMDDNKQSRLLPRVARRDDAGLAAAHMTTTSAHGPATNVSPPPPRRDEMFSPMDVDEPSPPPTLQFSLGLGNPRQRVNRPRPRPRPVTVDAFSAHSSPVTNKIHSSTKQNEPLVDYSGKVQLIASKREEAKEFYISGDYVGSILTFTEAIKLYGQSSSSLPGDVLAVLLSNRAAGLLMLGAYDAAVSDCQLALQHVSEARTNEPFSNDSGPMLKVKLHTRLARAYIKLGDHRKCKAAFEDAIKTANDAIAFSRTYHDNESFLQNEKALVQMSTEANLGLADAQRLADACDNLSKCLLMTQRVPTEKGKCAEALGHVNVALSIASGSVNLSESKVNLLSNLKRWREVAGYCERLAASNVPQEKIYVEDLASKNPFPGIPAAAHLKADFFGDSRDEDSSTRELKLNSKAAAEAVLRMPTVLSPYYLRALRLEERYPAADAALRALEDFSTRIVAGNDPQNRQNQYAWLPTERRKLDRTKELRERGDELFRISDFDLAAAQYTQCLKIDGEGLPEATDGMNAGGRLHAVLHCNRAACLMALRRFHGAVEECTSALKIHPRYMKAILRRARCYTRLQRPQEAISEYKRWLDLVEEAKKPGAVITLSPCLFDGPSDVKPSEVAQVQKELDEVYQSRRRAEANAREEAGRRNARERERVQDNFTSSWRSTNSNNAHERRDQWYNQQNDQRRWDSFTNRGPRSHSQTRAETWGNRQHQEQHHARSRSQDRPRQEFVSPRSSTGDHYSVLEVSHNASEEEIKRSFRRLALKYHPDKNKDEGASDNFRRVKLAHEILSDPLKRRQYDDELRVLGRRNHF